jgi:RsiW-degrading membrane proteinase PrsW (M82 family)
MLIFIILLIFVLIAAGLAWYLIAEDHGEKEPIGALWLAFGFGFGGGIVAALIENAFIPVKDLNPISPLPIILLTSLAIGVIEESCKFIPLSLFLYPKRFFNEHTDGLIYFALAGLGFGLPENILYTLQFGASTGLSRILLTPFFHAATTGIVGFFLIRAKLAKRSRAQSWLILAAVMLLHGLYDFGLASGVTIYVIASISITLTLSILLFLFYFRAVELDQRLGLSAVGHNSFCRNCGHPNPEHNLYCAHCGQRA